MKKITATLTVLFTLSLPLAAQDASGNLAPVSRQLYSFSPMARVYLAHLGLTDRNSNGVIDKDAGEGYEQFTAKYGNADIGFHANGVVYGAANGKLEEPEIINHYYIKIRFKPAFEAETTAIESEVRAFIYANNIPLVWMDDEQDTVMKAVNGVLGEGWNEKEVTEDEAIALFNRAMSRLGIWGRTGDLKKTGYYTLPELITQKAGYCFETAQFGFWFFSELGINSVPAEADLTSSISHEVLRLNSGRMVDYFDGSNGYNVPRDRWHTRNPLQDLGLYYIIKRDASRTMLEQSVLYDKYDITTIGRLMNSYFSSSAQYYINTIVELGEFILQNNDIDKILNARHLKSSYIKRNVKIVLIMLLVSYNLTNNRTGFENAAGLLQKYFRGDNEARRYLEEYRF